MFYKLNLLVRFRKFYSLDRMFYKVKYLHLCIYLLHICCIKCYLCILNMKVHIIYMIVLNHPYISLNCNRVHIFYLKLLNIQEDYMKYNCYSYFRFHKFCNQNHKFCKATFQNLYIYHQHIQYIMCHSGILSMNCCKVYMINLVRPCISPNCIKKHIFYYRVLSRLEDYMNYSCY